MLKTNSTQICLRNGSLEDFSKYIRRKPVDRELWRRNVQDTAIFIEWRPGTSRMTELTNNFEDKTHGIPRTYSRTVERKHKYIYRMTAGILKTKRHETYYPTQFIHGLHLWIFQKAEIALAEAARENFSLLKNSLAQIDSKLNSDRKSVV